MTLNLINILQFLPCLSPIPIVLNLQLVIPSCKKPIPEPKSVSTDVQLMHHKNLEECVLRGETGMTMMGANLCPPSPENPCQTPLYFLQTLYSQQHL